MSKRGRRKLISFLLISILLFSFIFVIVIFSKSVDSGSTNLGGTGCLNIFSSDCGKKENGANPDEPKGFLDEADCSHASGWACDPNDYNKTIEIHFYIDGPAGNGGKGIGSVTANLERESSVGNECGGNSSHGFVWGIPPDSIKDGQNHNIYAYAINIPSGDNPQLIGSPKTIENCGHMDLWGEWSVCSPACGIGTRSRTNNGGVIPTEKF